MSRAAPDHLCLDGGGEHLLELDRQCTVVLRDEVRRGDVLVCRARERGRLDLVRLGDQSRLPQSGLGVWQVIEEDLGSVADEEASIWL